MTSTGNLRVHTQGDSSSPTIVFLHAFPLSAAMWKDQMRHFSEKFYCVAPDLPGFGDSPLPDHAFTFEFYVDSVLTTLRDAQIQKSIWCGLSMGGYLALRMFERAPDLCRSLILCDTKAAADENEVKVKRWASIQKLRTNRDEFNKAQWQALIGNSSKENLSLKKNFEGLVGAAQSAGIASGLVAMATRLDSSPNLSRIQVPTLILVGEEDLVTPISDAQALAKGISGSKLAVVKQAGHLSNLEQSQAFNQELVSFLETRFP